MFGFPTGGRVGREAPPVSRRRRARNIDHNQNNKERKHNTKRRSATPRRIRHGNSGGGTPSSNQTAELRAALARAWFGELPPSSVLSMADPKARAALERSDFEVRRLPLIFALK